MNRRRILTVFTCLVATLAFMQPVTAQVLGSISGFVTDDSGAALPGVDVEAVNVDTGARRAGMTNEAGLYRLTALAAGIYDVTGSLDGFQSVKRERVQVQLGQDVTIGLSLAVGSVAEAITVTAETPAIEVSRSSTASYIGEEEIAALPIAGRDFTDFALLTPTVQRDPVRGFLTMSGQRGIYTGMNIDGTSGKSAFFGYGRGGEATENDGLVVAQDSVKEFQVITNGFAPEYGANGGGYINVITKSGTNEIKGSAFYYFTDESMIADVPASPLSPNSGGAPDEFKRTNIGASIGGAFIKDRTHYFASIDQRDRDEPFSQSLDDPRTYDAIIAKSSEIPGLELLVDGYTRNADGTADGLFNRTVDNQIVFLKLDQQFNDSNSGSFRINHTTYERSSSFADEESLKTEDTDSFVASIVSVFGSSKVNEFRVQSAKDDLDRLSTRVGGPVEAQIQFRTGEFDQVGKFDFLPIIAAEDKLQVQNSFSYLFGDHDMKFGVDYQKDDLAQVFKGSADGRYRYNSYEDFANDNPSSVRIYFGDVSFPNYDEAQTITALYAQDAWRPNSRLTLNYGFRWSMTDNPGNLEHIFPEGRNIPDDNNNFAPRFGFAYALNDEGTQMIRGGVGLFFGRTPTLLFASQVQENGIFPNYGRVIVGPGDVGYVPLGQTIDNENPPVDTIPGTSFVRPNFEDPETTRINFGYERELGDSGWTGGVDLVYAEGSKLQSNVDENRTLLGVDEFGRPMYSSDRPDPSLGTVFVRESFGTSEFTALTFKAARRYRGRYQVQAHYTWSEDKSTDDNERSATSVSVSNPFDINYDFGLSDRDVTDRLVVSGLVDLPFKLRLSGSFKYRSGTPYTLIDNSELFAYCGFGALDFNCNDVRAIQGGRAVARNTARNEDVQTMDLRLTRSFSIGDRINIDLFYEAFNFLNENSFTVGTGQADPTEDDFGLASNLVGSQRQYQWGVRIHY